MTSTTTIMQPSSIYTGPTTSYTNTVSSTSGHVAAWRTTTVESSIVPVISTLSRSHKNDTQPTSVNELNTPIYNETEHPTSSFSRRKNERNPKSLVLKKDILPSKAKILTSAQQTDNSSNPIKPVHPSATSKTSIYGSTIKPAQMPTTNTSVLDRRPSTPPPHRSNSTPTTTTRPFTPPPTRMYV